MKTRLSIVLLPCAVFAATTIQIPSPVASGRQLLLQDGNRLPDGTWVVADTADRVWYSTDRGTNWATVPVPEGDSIEIFGNAVVDDLSSRYWLASTGWKPMSFPASYQEGHDSYIGSSGERSFFDDQKDSAWFYVSDDSLRTWKEVLKLPSKVLPPEPNRLDFHRALDKYWFVISDSGYFRGTSNGLDWVRVELPKGLTLLFPNLDSRESALQAVARGSRNETFVLSTTNMGADWDTLFLKEPGDIATPIGNALFWSITLEDSREVSWLASDRQGPWSRVDALDVHAMFVENGAPYAIAAQGIFRIDLAQVGVRSTHGLDAVRARRDDRLVEFDVPASLAGSGWKVVGADGRLVASGRAVAGRNRVEGLQGPAWLRLGDRVVSLPAF